MRTLLSVLTGSVVLLLITAIAWRWLGIPSARSAWLVGLLWLALTLAFEFGFMHYVAGASWERLLAEYRVHEGRLWPLVLLTTLLAPIMIGWWRGYPRP